ncbi:MAG: regulatory protein RecX [Acidobacteriaceae bacterium]
MRSRKKPTPLNEDGLYHYAVKLLGQQMRTVSEVKRLLRRRLEPDESGEVREARLDAVIARLHEYKYLDDPAYAQTYARLRQENASLGKRRVEQDLMRKGVAKETIKTTLDAAYEGVGEEELARRHLERKRIRKPEDQKQAARVARMLMRAGFSMGAIVRILKKWDVEESALAAMESADADEDEPDA